MNSPTLIAYGIAFGLGAAVPIGPVNIEIARRALTRSFAAGLALGLGAVTVDTTFVILAALGLAPLIHQPLIYWPLTVGGIGMLVYLGVMSLVSARRAWQNDDLAPTPVPDRKVSPLGGYLTGLLMTALNPMTIVVWFFALPGSVATITQRPEHDLPMICAGVFIGTSGWVVFFAGLMSLCGRWRRAWWLVVADVIGGITLLAFACVAVWRSIA